MEIRFRRTDAAPDTPAGVPAVGPSPGAPPGAAIDRGALVFGFAFLAVFACAFTLAGGWFLWKAAAQLRGGDRHALLFLPVAAAFLLVGVGLLIAVVRGPSAVRADERTQAQFPDEPWKWRADWAQGYARDDTRGAFGSSLVFALLWNLISAPAAWIAWDRGVRAGQRAALLALIFPLVGVAMAANAVREGIRLARFRKSRLDLDAVPVPVGRTLSGTVRTHLADPPPGGFHVTLSAVRTERTGTGSNTTTWTRVVWQDEAQVEGRLAADPRGEGTFVSAPIVFRVPAEAEGTDRRNLSNRLDWKLEVSAREPGVDYRSVFAVPIYRTAASDLPETAANAVHLSALIPRAFAVEEPSSLATAPRPEPASSIRVADEGGGLVIDYPAARNRGAALGLTAFWVLWTVLSAVLLRLHAPLIFPLVWGFFDLALGYGALALWLTVTHVRVDASGVSVASGIGRPGAPRLVPKSDVADVRIAVGMSSGTTAYFDVRVIRRDGGAVAAGGAIRHRAEAEWIAARMLGALGLADAQHAAEPGTRAAG